MDKELFKSITDHVNELRSHLESAREVDADGYDCLDHILKLEAEIAVWEEELSDIRLRMMNDPDEHERMASVYERMASILS